MPTVRIFGQEIERKTLIIGGGLIAAAVAVVVWLRARAASTATAEAPAAQPDQGYGMSVPAPSGAVADQYQQQLDNSQLEAQKIANTYQSTWSRSSRSSLTFSSPFNRHLRLLTCRSSPPNSPFRRTLTQRRARRLSHVRVMLLYGLAPTGSFTADRRRAVPSWEFPSATSSDPFRALSAVLRLPHRVSATTRHSRRRHTRRGECSRLERQNRASTLPHRHGPPRQG